MTYELAKQLKDTGFPQDYEHRVLHYAEIAGHEPHELMVGRMFAPPCDADVQVPTLSELIEACGRSLVFIRRVAALHEQQDKWQSGNDIIFFEGSTPEEAVAKLWLALHH